MLNSVPRRIWFHWMQGRQQMPPVVRACLLSWTRLNPDWEVVFLDGQSVWEHLDRHVVPIDTLLATSPQVYANAIRLRLLDRHGGVWVDATTWCRRPLSTWLVELPGEFFAFASPGADRMIANWFLASPRGGYVVRTLADEYIGLFERLGPLPVLPPETAAAILAAAKNTDVFVDPDLLTARGYPYFLFHYVFAALYRRDSRFRSAWDECARIGAQACHRAQSLNLLAPADAGAVNAICAADPPMHKLTWRISAIPERSLLNAIVEGRV